MRDEIRGFSEVQETKARRAAGVSPPRDGPSPKHARPAYARRAPFLMGALAAALTLLVSCAAAAQEPAEPPKKAPPAAKKREKKKDEVIRFTGRLTNADDKDKHRPGCFIKVHVVKMKPGKSYIIEMHDRNAISNMDPYLRLENSKQERLRNEHGGYLEDDDGAGNLNSRLVFTPTYEDEYRIIATTLGAGRVGDYAVMVTPVPVGTPAPTRGQPLTLLMPIELGDIIITPHPAWGVQNTGNTNESSHGYIEYRFTIENLSETRAHEVQLTLPRNRGMRFYGGRHLQSIKRKDTVDPQAVVEVSLFQPDMPMTSVNDVEVHIDGNAQEFGVPVQLFSNRGMRINPFGPRFMSGIPGGGGAQANVLIAPGFGDQVTQNVFKSAVGVYDAPLPGASNIFSGDYLAPGPYFKKRYVFSQTNRLLPSNVPLNVWSRHWLGYTSYDGIALSGQQLQTAPADVQQAIFEFTESGGALFINGPCKLPEGWERTRADSKYFKVYYPGFGQCLVNDGFFGINHLDPDAWREITAAWSDSAKAWDQHRTPTQANRELPVLDEIGIPVRGLFLFMILFVVLIGPVNFYWLTRTRRRIWLLWTVPVFSLATCAVLFGYMLISEGWRGHVRTDSVTVLDEVSQRAATIGWQGFYTPTISSGLTFRDDTELTAHLASDRAYHRNGAPHTINWTGNQQHLDTGWLDAKVPIHFMVRRNEKSLERMLVRKHEGSIFVVNGLPVDVETIWLATLDGQVWTGKNLNSGKETRLEPANLALNGKANGHRQSFAASWAQAGKEMEKRPEYFLRPGCYLAVVDGAAPFLEDGLDDPQGRRMRSVVYGILKEPQ